MKWWTVFQDETLQALIKEALANNYDMRIAATRILQASANLGITRANQFPHVERELLDHRTSSRRRYSPVRRLSTPRHCS